MCKLQIICINATIYDMRKYLTLPPLTNNQIEIITGSLLGDASIWHRSHANCKLTKSQSCLDICDVDKISYMQWHINALHPYGNNTIGRRTSNLKITRGSSRNQPISTKTSEIQRRSYVFTTHCHPVFTELSKKWYATDTSGYIIKNGRRIKIVPNDIKITPLTLCVWHMDDGYANSIDGNITLNTQGFSWEECEFLSERLKIDLDITSKVRAKDGSQIIYVPLKSYFNFIDIIKPYVEWNCFRYKIDTETYDKKPQIGETHSQSKLSNQKIKQIIQLHKNGWSQKDLAIKFRTVKANISLIVGGRHWSHITGVKYAPIKPRVKMDIKKQIVELAKTGLTQKAIADMFGINQATVSRAIKGAICQTLET